MRGTTAVAAMAVIPVLLTGCSDVEDLPDSSEFRTCLEQADVDPGDLESADARAEAFTDPAALDCVAGLDTRDQQDTLSGVFSTEELADALVNWINRTDAGPEVEARTVGALAGAGGDPEDSDVDGGALDEHLAVQIRHQEEPSTLYQAWLQDAEAQASVPDGEPLHGSSLYLDWLEDHGGDSPEYAEAQEIRDLQDLVAQAREAAADGD